jgi:hypothetical protein
LAFCDRPGVGFFFRHRGKQPALAVVSNSLLTEAPSFQDLP